MDKNLKKETEEFVKKANVLGNELDNYEFAISNVVDKLKTIAKKDKK